MEKIKSKAPEVVLTALMFGWIFIALLGGAQLLGLITVSTKITPYLGAALIGYVFVAGVVVTNLCVKFILKKEGKK